MSRLRRPFLSDRYFFATVRVAPHRPLFGEVEFAALARSIHLVRLRQRFLLTAWVFLPDHWHAIICPPHPLTISTVMKSLKLTSANALRGTGGAEKKVWQGRFHDRALRTVREYWEAVEYIHLNPVRRGLVRQPAEWRWSSAAEYSGVTPEDQHRRCGLAIDRVSLPAEASTWI
jgi:putative transposase